MNNKIHLIFEGCELVGKSYLMAQVYNVLEKEHQTSKYIMNGCHWFNSDVGIFGTEYGQPIVDSYIDMLEVLRDKCVLFEKLHLSDVVYNKMCNNIELDYSQQEERLLSLNAKIILLTIDEDETLIKSRLEDRLRLYPHYSLVLKEPGWYLEQQQLYLEAVSKSRLPFIKIDMTEIPNKQSEKVLKWAEETI